MDAELPVEKHGFLEALKEYIVIPQWLANLNVSAYFVFQLGIFFVSGFLVGFLTHRYIRSLLLICIIVGCALVALHYLNIVSIHSNKVKELLGIAPTDNFGELCSSGLAWMRSHVIFSISVILGFFIGFRVG